MTALKEPFDETAKAFYRHKLQNTVFAHFKRTFNQVPDSIVQKIETSSDLEQLDKWLDQIIVAKELGEIIQIFKT